MKTPSAKTGRMPREVGRMKLGGWLSGEISIGVFFCENRCVAFFFELTITEMSAHYEFI